MIDIKSIQDKLNSIYILGQYFGSDAESENEDANKRCDNWERMYQALKQEILWEIEILNLEAEKYDGPSLVELCSQLGKIEEVSGVVK